MRRTVVVLAVAVASCAPRVAITSGSAGVSLIPKGTAVALQPMTSADVVAGKLVHIDAGEIIILTSRGPVGVKQSVVKAFQRDEVLTLYRRPGSRLGIAFLVGTGLGAAAGYVAAGILCDRGSLPDCDTGGYYGDPEENRTLARAFFAGIGAFVFGGIAHTGDAGAQGMDPSDWVEIKWPGEKAVETGTQE